MVTDRRCGCENRGFDQCGAVWSTVRCLSEWGGIDGGAHRPAQLDEMKRIFADHSGRRIDDHRKLMHHYGFVEPVRQFAAKGKAIFGTCAGSILLASNIEREEGDFLRLMNTTVSRNAFGRQRDSFEVVDIATSETAFEVFLFALRTL